MKIITEVQKVQNYPLKWW